MLPTINGKDLFQCTETDFQEIIGNSEYAESQQLDYKGTFEILFADNRENRTKRIDEFCDDICAFANTNGGYLVYGVQQDGNGLPKNICGVRLKDGPDAFETHLKDWMNPIHPQKPRYATKLLSLSNGCYLIIILVFSDAFFPYLRRLNEKSFVAIKRIGKTNTGMAYQELKTMFDYSSDIRTHINIFRSERIRLFSERGNAQFMLLHIIPDTFKDTSTLLPPYVAYRNDVGIRSIFEQYYCVSGAQPTVDGVSVKCMDPNYGFECNLLNNYIAEAFSPLLDEKYTLANGREFLSTSTIWDYMEKMINKYIEVMPSYLNTSRLFICFSLIGCNGLFTEQSDNSIYPSSIDRNMVVVEPTVFEDITQSDETEVNFKHFHLSVYLALGIRYKPEYIALIKELYDLT